MTAPPRQRPGRLRMEFLEDRTTPAVAMYGGDAQHTGLSAVASQPIQAVHWSNVVDSYFSGGYGHYGAPLATDANTIIIPSKTGPNTSPAFHVVARNGTTGAVLWDVATDWAANYTSWYPPYQPALSTATNRIYYAGAGGTIWYRTNPDSTTGVIGQLAFYGTLTDYLANYQLYNAYVYVDTPLTVDNQGNVFFGFRVIGATPQNLSSGIARIAPDGTATWVSARAAANNDPAIDLAARNSAPALSNDHSTLYFVAQSGPTNHARLVALDATTLATQHVSAVLKDPRNANNANINANSTASPVIGPDGRVFFGVLASPDNAHRGWMLQLSADLATVYTPGGFGWDATPSIVPTSMVPQYTGTSPYLLFTKYNDYGYGDGTGLNKIAILDPFDTAVDPHTSSNGLLIMKPILTKLSPSGVNPLTEWCINSAFVDPFTQSVLVNNEDGKVYRWHLPTNTLPESIALAPPGGQPYTPTVVGLDGTVYGMGDGILYALGKTPGLAIADATVASPATTAALTVTLDFPRTAAITVHYETADLTALAGVQYTATSGDLTFEPGQMSKTITVPINPAAVVGASAAFAVNLSSPGNAVLADAQARVTLLGRPPRVQSVAVNGGAAQRSRVTSIAVHFDQIVTLPAAAATAFQLIRQGTGGAVTLASSISTVGDGTVVMFNFLDGPIEGGSLADGLYSLTVLASLVGNAAGSLDGNGDSTGGDNYLLTGSPAAAPQLYRLFGDDNADGTVDGNDLASFGAAFGQTVTGSAFDFNNDNTIDATDFSQFGNRFGLTV